VSKWPSSKARKVFAAIQRAGCQIKKEKGSSHKQMIHLQWGEVTWAFHDDDEIGPRMLARIAKNYHITPEDL